MIPWTTLAFAAAPPSLDGFAGSWGLDPSKSDDPSEAFAAASVRPTVTSGDAASYSPDGVGDVTPSAANGDEGDDGSRTRRAALDDAYTLLGWSGGVSVRPVGGEVEVTWTGKSPVLVPLTRRYVKVKSDDPRWRARAWMDGANLVVERKLRSTSVAETLLPDDRPDELVVVVWVEGSTLTSPVEFRRVYRSLASGPAPAP